MAIQIKFLRMRHIIRTLNDNNTFSDFDHKSINSAKRASRMIQAQYGACLRVVDQLPVNGG